MFICPTTDFRYVTLYAFINMMDELKQFKKVLKYLQTNYLVIFPNRIVISLVNQNPIICLECPKKIIKEFNKIINK